MNLNTFMYCSKKFFPFTTDLWGNQKRLDMIELGWRFHRVNSSAVNLCTHKKGKNAYTKSKHSKLTKNPSKLAYRDKRASLEHFSLKLL